MKDITIKNIIKELENLFDLFNNAYFENKLSKPVITVSPDMTKGAYGWCTSWKAWKDSESEYYEINMCAEHLTRSFSEIAGTMLHEMVHLYNLENGIKDYSRGGTYHNKHFKEAAESHGLITEATEKYGYAKTKLNGNSENLIETFDGKSAFVLFRESGGKNGNTKKKSKSSSRKYVCPCCGLSIRATKEVKVVCYDCNEILVEEN